MEESGLVMKYDAEGNLLAVMGWNPDQSNRLENFCFDPWDRLTVVGWDGWDLLITWLDSDLNVVEGVVRTTEVSGNVPTACGYDTDRNLYIVGWAESHVGEWAVVEDRSFLPEGIEGPAEGSTYDISGSSWAPEGTLSEADGVIDTSTGSEDFLILKNYPK
jgi:hypothetical protein